MNAQHPPIDRGSAQGVAVREIGPRRLKYAGSGPQDRCRPAADSSKLNVPKMLRDRAKRRPAARSSARIASDAS